MRKVTRHALRDLPSQVYLEQPWPADFYLFASQELLPKLKFTGHKVGEKRSSALFCLHSLICHGLTEHTVADGRDYHFTPQIRIAVWDAIIKARMAIMCLGSEKSGKVTRYYPTSWLLSRRTHWEQRMLCDPDAPPKEQLIVLNVGATDPRTGQPVPEDQQGPVALWDYLQAGGLPPDWSKLLPEPTRLAVENELGYFAKIEDAIDRINRNNLEHSWQALTEITSVAGHKKAITFQPSVCLRQIHAGDLFRCVRLYTWGPLGAQGMKKEQRRTMLIDGEPVAELDFSALHLSILYHLMNVDPAGDAYRPDQICPTFYSFKNVSPARKKVVRDLVKQATNICLNTKSRAQAVAALRKVLDESPRELKHIVYTVERSGASDLLRRIEKAHPELQTAGKFYSEAASELMTADGKMMLHILLKFVAAQKPALGVHDSVVVRESDAAFAEEVMSDVYQQFFPGHLPLIHRV